MPKTDKNGTASVEIVKTQDTVYLKEITAPTGYAIDATAYNVTLTVGKTVKRHFLITSGDAVASN